MGKNYLLEYSEQLTTEIELLCQNIMLHPTPFFRFEKAQAVFMPIYGKQITGKAKRIFHFPSLRLSIGGFFIYMQKSLDLIYNCSGKYRYIMYYERSII